MVPSPEHPSHRDQPERFQETPPNPETASSLKVLENQMLDWAEASLKSGDASGALQLVAEALSCCKGEFSDQALQVTSAALNHPSLRLENPALAAGCLRLQAAVKGAGYGPLAGCWVAS